MRATSSGWPRYGRYAVRIDATRRGLYPWLINLEGHSVRKAVPPP